MGSDGAHQGVGAKRALETILGGKPSPKKKERQTREQVRERLSRSPSPDGPSPTDYGDAADAIARVFLTVVEESPGMPLEEDALWAAVNKRWPKFDDWIGGATGFQVGWAVNCVRWLAEAPPAPNPALIEVEVK